MIHRRRELSGIEETRTTLRLFRGRVMNNGIFRVTIIVIITIITIKGTTMVAHK